MKRFYSLPILFISLFLSQSADAANRYWISNSGTAYWNSTSNWSTTNGGSGGASIPGAGDMVYFTSSRTGSCYVNANVNVAGISMTGYSGNFVQGGYNVTTGSLVRNTGTFTGGSGTINVNGDFTLYGGSFTSTTGTLFISGNWYHSSGSFSHNNGTVQFNGSNASFDAPTNETFKKLTINKDDGATLTISGSDALYILDDFILSNGIVNNGSFVTYHDVTVQSGYDGGNTQLQFVGSSTQYFNLTGATDHFDGDILVNKSSGYQLVLSSNLTMDAAGQDLSLQSGMLNLNGRTCTVYNAGLSSGTLNILGSFSLSGSGSFNVYNYQHTTSGTFSIVSGSTFRVYNNFVKSSSSYASFSGGTATLYFDGGFYNYAGSFTSTSGNAYFSGAFSQTSGNFSHNNGTVNFTGNASTIDVSSNITFSKINFNKNDNQTLSIASGDILYILSDVSYLNGLLSTGTVYAYSTVVIGSAWDGGNAALWFVGSNTQSFNLLGAESNFEGDIYINKSSGYQVQMASNLIMSASGQDLFLQSGILNLVGRTVTVHNPGASTGTVYVQGSFNIYGGGTFNAYNYSHITSGTLSLSNSFTFRIYNNFVKSNSSYASFSAGSATLYFDGDFYNYAGSFTSTSGHAYFSGNYTSTSGSFSHNNGTVHFIGGSSTYSVASNETYNNLTLNKNHGSNLTISTGDIMYVLGLLQLTNGSASTGSVYTYANVNVGTLWDGGNASLTFVGSSTQTFTLTGAESLFEGDIIVNKSSGYQLIMASNINMAATGQDFYAQSGVLNLNGRTVTIYNPIANSGTLNVQGSFSIYGNGTLNMYKYAHSTSGTFTISNTPTFRVYNTFVKSASSYATFNGGSATIYLLGDFYNYAGNFTASSANTYFGADYTKTSGTFSHNNGTVHFIGDDADFDLASAETFYNLRIDKDDNKTLTLASGDLMYVLGTMTFNNGKASGSEIKTYGNVNVESGWDGGNTALAFIGSYSQNFDLSGAESTFDGILNIEKSSGYTLTMYSDMTMNGAGQKINLYSGQLALNNKTITLFNATNNTGDLNVFGSFNLIGNGALNVYNHLHGTSGTFRIYNSPTYRIYNNFTQTSSSYANFEGAAATLIVDGNFTKSAGSFVAPTAHFKLGGNWSITGGSYTDNGTLTFIGGDATFYSVCTFGKVVMDKDSGASLTIANSGDIIVTNSLTFTSGIVNTNAQGTLTTNCNVVVSGGTDCGNPISYVNGPFTRTLCTTTPTNMYFPVGKGGNFRPTWLEPTQTTAGATTYTVEQFEGFPPNYCVPEDLTCLSKARWYRVERGNTVPMIDPITITYCANDGVTHPNNLRIAKQEGNCWKNMGGVGTSATQGTITSTVDFTEYGDFVLANDTDCMNPLPVQLLSFEGNYSNSIEYLKWVTASEKNNDRFEVMRSEDGVNWYMIGEVQGNGFSEKLQEYFYEDHDIPMGATVLYYRLRQVDYNGDFEYHPIIVQDLNNTKITLNSINVFPNPAKDKFSVVNLGNTRMPNTIKVLDLYGHLLLQKDFNGSTEVNTMDYPTGIYMLKITNAQGMVVDVRKIQISK